MAAVFTMCLWAVEEEEKLKYLIEGAKLRFEHWKTEQFNMRVEARAMS